MAISRRAFIEALSAAGLVTQARALRAAAAPDRITLYPQIETQLRQRAGDRARPLTTAGLDLRPDHGALAASLDDPAISLPGAGPLRLPSDGLLTFAVDVPAPVWVRGTLRLEPDVDHRPGLRATVLCDTTVIAAPMQRAPEWRIAEVTDAAPVVSGDAPPAEIAVGPWLMPAGRRFLTVGGPHMRPGGTLAGWRLEVIDRAVETPLYTFAFIADTHVRRAGREDWMNRKMGEASAPELLRTLHALADEGVAFVVHGGDMTERATRDEFWLMRDVLRQQPLPVFGCIGNHDRYLPSSRSDALEVLAAHFPSGALDYVLPRAPLRFVVLDVALELPERRARALTWLRDTLAADMATPTVFVWHYPPFNRGTVSNSGLRVPDWSQLGRETLLDVLRAAPQVCAALNGHDHWDEVNTIDRLPFIQNAAFVEWPNTFRVYRVYRDRLDWEVRQVGNRGFVRESFLPAKAVSWMIATGDDDLRGSVSLARRG